MSSIYRKGRDGYFYYQTYIRNKKTGKKDKRIFHSLGTKDKVKAEEKKQQLDKKYADFAHNYENSRRKYYLNYLIPVLVILLFCTHFLFQKNTKKVSSIKNIKLNQMETEINSTRIKKRDSLLVDSRNTFLDLDKKKSNIINQGKRAIPFIDSKKQTNKINITSIPVQKVPNHTIVRVETISDAFRQGEIHVILEENIGSDSKLLLCKSIMEKYSEFSNIIICLYSNSTLGADLALGKDIVLSDSERKKAMLAMFTYNDVEGVFFDDNPSRYIGVP